MQAAMDSLRQAHQQLKDHAIQQLQNDQDIDQHVLDGIKAVYALILALNQASTSNQAPAL